MQQWSQICLATPTLQLLQWDYHKVLLQSAKRNGNVKIELLAQGVVPYARHLFEAKIVRRQPSGARYSVVHDGQHLHDVVAMWWQPRRLGDNFAERPNVPKTALRPILSTLYTRQYVHL